MRYSTSVMATVLAAMVFAGCEHRSPGVPMCPSQVAEDSPRGDDSVLDEGTDADGEPLLLLEDEAPLLFEDEPKASLEAAGSMADNSRCHHCHLNYVEEQLAVVHARAKIGCADCHGASDEHIADESWASGGNGTAPDVMFPREKINPFCLECHAREKMDTGEHEAFFVGTVEEKFCTDCHGDHRLGDRKCTWK